MVIGNTKVRVRVVAVVACFLAIATASPHRSLADGLDPVAAGVITGTVTDAQGRPVSAGVTVRRTDSTQATSTGTDRNGHYTLSRLAPGTYRVEFQAFGYSRQWFNGADTAEAADLVTVVDQHETPLVDAVLQPAPTFGTISGLVTDREGRPLAGIGVFVNQPEPGNEGTGVTDADGRYTTTPVMPGDFMVHFGDPANRYAAQYYDNQPTSATANPVTVLAGADTPGIGAQLDVVLTGVITGTVTDAQGRAIFSVGVTARRTDSTQATSTGTDRNGNYTLSRLAPGTYRVEFQAFGYSRQWFNGADTAEAADLVTVVDQHETPLVDAVLQPAPTFGTISGLVTDREGRPLAGITVSVNQPEPGNEGTGVTDVDGRYTTTPVMPGDFTVRFFDPANRYAAQYYDNQPTSATANPVTVLAGADTPGIGAQLDVVLTGVITGTVTDAQGRAIFSVGVTARRTDSTQATSTGTDRNGNYTLSRLAPGTYRVEFQAFGYSRQWFNGADTAEAADLVTVVDQQETTGIDAVLQPAPTFGTISGLVTDREGRPLAGIGVFVNQPEPGNEGTGVTDVDGRYTTTPVMPGDFMVHFGDPANRYASQYYDNQPTAATANPVTVLAGADTPNIDAAADVIPPPTTSTSSTLPASTTTTSTTTTVPVSTTTTTTTTVPVSTTTSTSTTSTTSTLPELTTTTVPPSTSTTVPERTLTAISVTPPNPSVAPGDTQQLTATGTYSEGPPSDLTESVEWTSADQGVATISSLGLVTAVAEGTTTIAATLGSLSGSTTVTVTPPLPETASAPVSPEAGGSVVMNPTPTPEEPVGTTVEVPPGTAGGTVSVTQSQPAGEAPPGYAFAGHQVDIESPPSTWDNPLRLVFLLDASAVPSGQDHTTIDIFRNGVLVAECAGSATAVAPTEGASDGQPCVSNRATLLEGHLEFTVLTPHASLWNLGVTTDLVPPQVAISSPAEGAVYVLGQTVAAEYACEDPTPDSSGLASCLGTVDAGAPVDTATVGAKTFVVSSSDHAGNHASVRTAYRVIYAYSATSGPLAAPATVHLAKAGKDVSLTFGLDGHHGPDIFEAGSPSSSAVTCPSSGSRAVLKQNANGKLSSLRYSATTDMYQYEWVTPKAWAGSCRQFTMTLRDGTVHTAVFEFR